MAEIVIGIGTSHSPLLTFGAPVWLERAEDDKRNASLTLSDGRELDYDTLLAERGPAYEDESGLPTLERQAARAQAALDRLAEALEAAEPDLVMIIGDDQEELFKPGDTPSFAIYCGTDIVMRPLGELMPSAPPWMKSALHGYAMDTEHRFSGAPDFALGVVEKLMDKGVDVAIASTVPDPQRAAFGHAYGFIAQRLLGGRSVPIVPIMLNTYYPPNVIRPGRCQDIGKMIGEAVAELPAPMRVAIVASGGLSHFVTDADLDRQVLAALHDRDDASLRNIPMAALRAGSSEILCWVMAGGALENLHLEWSDYLPVYRTPAGSGIGLAFAIWN